MKKLITKFAKWWLKRNDTSIELNSTITYCKTIYDVHCIDVCFKDDGKTELTIHARERENEV